MDPLQLNLPDGRSSGVWFCSKCHRTASCHELARQCCLPYVCSVCGKEAGLYRLKCEACCQAERDAREKDRFDKAEKLTQWDGWVFSDGHGYNNGYAESVEEVLETLENVEDIPDYVWTADAVQFVQVSIDDIKQGIEDSEQAYEDFDANNLDGLPELKKAIDAFNNANAGKIAYHVNYKRALLVDKAAIAKLINENSGTN